jgi:hypothetical protein
MLSVDWDCIGQVLAPLQMRADCRPDLLLKAIKPRGHAVKQFCLGAVEPPRSLMQLLCVNLTGALE